MAFLVATLVLAPLDDVAAKGGADSPPPGTAERRALRIVTLNPVATEIAFALGAGNRVVGVDQTSHYPAAVDSLPRVGYQRALAAEGILSLRPDLVLGTADAGPPAAIQSLMDAGVKVTVIPSEPTVAAARKRIQDASVALQVPAARVAALLAPFDAELARAEKRLSALKQKPRVLFLYTRGNAAALVSGAATPADAMIRLAGGVNAVGGFDGYRPLSSEAAVAAQPDVLLLPASAVGSLGGIDGVLAQAGLALTPAGRAKRVVVMDDTLLLGFGPRLGQAVNELADLLHPKLAASPK